jgi:PIN domain nuclease of toxin-antitoxin system
VRFLLDTHVFLWIVTDSPKRSVDVRTAVADADEVCVSAASIWEAAIKAGLGKIQGDVTESADAIGRSGFVELPVSARHAAAVAAISPAPRPGGGVGILAAMHETAEAVTSLGCSYLHYPTS